MVEGLSRIYTEAELPGLIELDVPDRDALETARSLIRSGFPVGPSSGLNLHAALLAFREGRVASDAVVVTIFPDRCERYFSTELFAE